MKIISNKKWLSSTTEHVFGDRQGCHDFAFLIEGLNHRYPFYLPHLWGKYPKVMYLYSRFYIQPAMTIFITYGNIIEIDNYL